MDLEPRWPPLVGRFFVRHPQWEPIITSGVPPGWDAIVANALQRLEALRVSTGVEMALAQVKEKFGGLRLYVQVEEFSVEGADLVAQTDDHLRIRSGTARGSVRAWALKITDEAELQAAHACIRCGVPATRQLGHYRFCAVHDSAWTASGGTA